MSLEHAPQRQRGNGNNSKLPYDLLSTDEVAARLHCSRTTLSRNYAKWGLKPIRFGGRLLFSSEQLLELERRMMSGEQAS